MGIKCIICNKNADYVFNGNSYCEEHIEQAKIMAQKVQQGMGNMLLNLQRKMVD